MYSVTKFVCLCALLACWTASASDDGRQLITEVGSSMFKSVTVPCNASVVGSVAACFDSSIAAVGNTDPSLNSSVYKYSADGSPWGISLIGPYPDGVSYRLTWNSGNHTMGPLATLTGIDNTTKLTPQVRLTRRKASKEYSGETITYIRAYLASSGKNGSSYLSPLIHHVVLDNLLPGKTYDYELYNGNGTWSEMRTFTTLRTKNQYPIRIGVIGDVGQTMNSSLTRDRLVAHKPQVILNMGDLTYADHYAPDACDAAAGGSGTCPRRWDSWSQMWESAWSFAPVVSAMGNHELETGLINASITYNETEYSYPSNYPYQSWTSRYPVPGIMENFGKNINSNLFFSTVVAGVIKVIVLNNYEPFHNGTKQYAFAMKELSTVDRSVTPWVFVIFHAPIYHSYVTHFKEMDCFASVYEDMFYMTGVDLVMSGHIHAYERSHPVYKYERDTCGPVHLVIGDGGNVEGPYRDFVDQVNPNDALNRTYCELLTYAAPNGTKLGPNQLQAAGGRWGPSYQTQAEAPGCNTFTYQSANGVAGGKVLVPKAGSPDLGFCQSSQPNWSAYRDPSFGHAMIEVQSDELLTVAWYRNMDGEDVKADSVTLSRLSGCPHRAGASRKTARKNLRKSA